MADDEMPEGGNIQQAAADVMAGPPRLVDRGRIERAAIGLRIPSIEVKLRLKFSCADWRSPQ